MTRKVFVGHRCIAVPLGGLPFAPRDLLFQWGSRSDPCTTRQREKHRRLKMRERGVAAGHTRRVECYSKSGRRERRLCRSQKHPTARGVIRSSGRLRGKT